jgi:hypothetical protein
VKKEVMVLGEEDSVWDISFELCLNDSIEVCFGFLVMSEPDFVESEAK